MKIQNRSALYILISLESIRFYHLTPAFTKLGGLPWIRLGLGGPVLTLWRTQKMVGRKWI